MKLAPNQKGIIIHKEKAGKEGSGRPFSMIDHDALQNAVQLMNGKHAAGFILWSILASNKDGHELPISVGSVSSEYSISKDSYDSGIRILIEKGFLVRNHGNMFDFFEYPEQYKSWKTQLLNVGKSHNQKSENPTFKSGKTPQDNNILDNITDNTTTNPPYGLPEEIVSAAADAGFDLSKATRNKIQKLTDQYGTVLMLNAISACVEGQVITLAYLRGCLKNMKNESAGGDDPNGVPYLDDKHEYIGG